jgi:hypothetical protein
MDAHDTLLRAKDPLMQTRTSLVHGTGVDEAYGLIHHGCGGGVLSVCVSRVSSDFDSYLLKMGLKAALCRWKTRI